MEGNKETELTDDDYCNDCRMYHKDECEYDTDGRAFTEEEKKQRKEWDDV